MHLQRLREDERDWQQFQESFKDDTESESEGKQEGKKRKRRGEGKEEHGNTKAPEDKSRALSAGQRTKSLETVQLRGKMKNSSGVAKKKNGRAA